MNELVYKYFKEISNIPRETYNIKNISNYLVKFAKDKDLEVYQDNELNVIIKKEASSGYFDHDSIILQTHMDMVCQKDDDSNHDFEKDPIEIIENNEFLTANKTTLGADNGIGMAIVLSILDSHLKHPKIEALFTVNEESGMEGAINLDITNLDAKRLINLDSEEEGILIAGCAGGVRIDITYNYKTINKSGYLYTINLSNLLGGHSGSDINKKRINAIKCLSKFLNSLDNYYLVSINGGEVDNAICNNCKVKILSEDELDLEEFKAEIANYLDKNNEKDAIIDYIKEKTSTNVFTLEDTNNIIYYLTNCKDGVISFEEVNNSLVKTSLNLGVISTNNNQVVIKHLVRSSNDLERDRVVEELISLSKKINATSTLKNPYSGWRFRKESDLRDILSKVYKDTFNKELIVDTIHAGLECGILVNKRNDLDCVSIGPNIYNAHTSLEKVEIESVNRFYKYIIKVLENL